MFEQYDPLQPPTYELNLEIQHLCEVVRHCLRNVPFDSALGDLIRRAEFCSTVCAISFWKSEPLHPLSESALGPLVTAIRLSFALTLFFLQTL
jgi:hypothetical protein